MAESSANGRHNISTDATATPSRWRRSDATGDNPAHTAPASARTNQADDDEYPYSLPDQFPLPQPLEPRDVTKYCLEQFLPSGSPRQFQVEATMEITFNTNNLFLVIKTGNGEWEIGCATGLGRHATRIYSSACPIDRPWK